MSEIHIAAALVMRADGRTLLVRKRGTTAFMQPGGKIDQGEDARQALARELFEELALRIDPELPVHLGRHSAPAANEAGHVVVAQLFRLNTDADIAPQAEIEEIRWVDPAAAGDLELAPLTRDHVLPLAALR
jgi:8-oxo-dGTP diphosphatase